MIDQLSSEAGDGYPSRREVRRGLVGRELEQAGRKAAKNHLDMTAFSRDGLSDQLSSDAGDQYTREQAVYGVDQVGL